MLVLGIYLYPNRFSARGYDLLLGKGIVPLRTSRDSSAEYFIFVNLAVTKPSQDLSIFPCTRARVFLIEIRTIY